MPRIPRGEIGGHAHHVLNRGNGGSVIFHAAGDYWAFLDLLSVAKSSFPVKVFAFCLMPNHFHLVLQAEAPQALSTFMQWWMTSHVRRYHHYHETHGHIWQGRFKSFPVQEDVHLLTVIRYVLLNPVRAGLVHQVDEWPWSSHKHPYLTDPLPIALPRDWERWLEEPLQDQELTQVRTSVNRRAPFGSHDWQRQIANACGLETTLRPVGRPRKENGGNGDRLLFQSAKRL